MPAVAKTIIKPKSNPKIFQSSIEVKLPIELPVELPVEDGEPLETNSHRMAMTVLIQSLKNAWANRNDFFVGGNMFVYFSPHQLLNTDYRGPDFFVVLDTTKNDDREAWYIWEESGRKPNMVIELLSKKTRNFDLNQKKTIYEQDLETEDYFVFDPLNPSYLRGWHLVKGHYQELQPNKNGWLWAQSLNLWVGTWEGAIEQASKSRVWLRFYDTDGKLLFLAEEQERQQKEQAQIQAEQAQIQTEQAQIQTEKERQQKEKALLQADKERQQAEKERQRSEKLKELLQAQGINVDDIV